MPLFTTSTSSVTRHGAVAILRNPPTVLRAVGTGISALVGKFPWGPFGSIVEPDSPKAFFNTFAPPGFDRLRSGYLSFIAKSWPAGFRIVRILGSTEATATATLTAAGPTTILTVPGKYPGADGNSLVATVSDASDANALHFNLTVTMTGASGTTTDTIVNLNYSGTGADSLLSQDNLNQLLLIGQPVKVAAGRPVNGAYTFTGGLDGTIDAAAYVGTAGSGDKGIALLENDDGIDQFCIDDCGDSIRAAVNAGISAHAALMGDRIAFINGPDNQSAAAAQADKLNYNGRNVVYVDPWCRILDDVTGAKHDVPPAPFATAVCAQISPSTSIAIKNAEVGAMLVGIVELVARRDANAGTNTTLGIMTLIQERDGSFRFEAGVNTLNGSDPSQGTICRSRMAIYIAKTFVASTREVIDAPNVPIIQQQIVTALDRFLSGLKKAQSLDPIHAPFIVDYAINADGANSPADIAAGNFTIPADVIVGASIAKLILSLNIGETVTLSVT